MYLIVCYSRTALVLSILGILTGPHCGKGGVLRAKNSKSGGMNVFASIVKADLVGRPGCTAFVTQPRV